MKRKIILLLSIFVFAVIMTACGETEISNETLKEAHDVAYNVAFTNDYAFPPNYTVDYYQRDNKRIKIGLYHNQIDLIYTVEESDVSLNRVVMHDRDYRIIMLLVGMIIGIFGISMIVSYFHKENNE